MGGLQRSPTPTPPHPPSVGILSFPNSVLHGAQALHCVVVQFIHFFLLTVGAFCVSYLTHHCLTRGRKDFLSEPTPPTRGVAWPPRALGVLSLVVLVLRSWAMLVPQESPGGGPELSLCPLGPQRTPAGENRGILSGRSGQNLKWTKRPRYPRPPPLWGRHSGPGCLTAVCGPRVGDEGSRKPPPANWGEGHASSAGICGQRASEGGPLPPDPQPAVGRLLQ